MKIIKPEVKEIFQKEGKEGIYKAIEVAGRNCYKSEDKICEGSAEKLINTFLSRKHYSPLEFGTVYMKFKRYDIIEKEALEFYLTNPYTKVLYDIFYAYVTTNYRVIIENHKEEDIERYLCKDYRDIEKCEKRYFFKITTDRAILAEFTRHRVFSFCVESQRYCNYSKDKFNNEITFIEPCWFYNNENSIDFEIWRMACEESEKNYFTLLKNQKPEQARSVLNNSVKTEICMCGFESDWQRFLSLRTSEAAHPQARELAEKIKIIINRE